MKPRTKKAVIISFKKSADAISFQQKCQQFLYTDKWTEKDYYIGVLLGKHTVGHWQPFAMIENKT